MKNILVPSDLTQQSLEAVHQIVEKNPNDQVNIYLVHMVSIPTELSDLLFIKKNRLYDHVPYDFFKAIDDLRNNYPSQINSIRFEFYYGNRPGILKGIIENLEIDEICILNGYKYSLPLEESVNIIPFIDHCMVPVFKAPVFGKVIVQGDAKKSLTFPARELSSVMQ